MVLLIGQVRLSGIGNQHFIIRKIVEELAKQIPACQVLQPFMRMGDTSLQWHLVQEKIFRFCYMPDAQPGAIVDILLIKQGHKQIYNFSLQIYDLFAD